ncbi:tRNA pseudouridine(38-40) synthase [Bertholletia excelsa]
MEEPPSSPTEPEPKKLKMSTTSDDDDMAIADSARDSAPPKKQRYKRRKIAIFFAYCGVGYQGMQKNPGAKTIEGDLEEALFFSGAVPEEDRGYPKRFDWARSARTDKGVSAVGQVVSGRFYIDPPGLVDRLNSNLPPQIRMFGYKRVTASFNAKKFCDRRRYVYLLPVCALDPSSHRDRESVMASLGSDNELVKCLECSERGRKVVGLMGKRNFELNSDGSNASNSEVEVGTESAISINGTAVSESDVKEINGFVLVEPRAESVISSNNGDAVSDPEVREATGFAVISSNNGAAGVNSVVKETTGVSLDKSDNGSSNADSSMENCEVENKLAEEKTKIKDGFDPCGNEEEKPVKGSSFCYGERERERFNRILKHYEGTHNFHNFTTRTKAEDPSAKRFIVSFDAKTTLTVQGIEFVKCEVVGQSFMLHQIRKMVGLAVAIMRNCAPESLLETAMQQDVNINVPTAPEVGLYLDECLFASYNQKWKDSHEELSMKAYAEEAESFKMDHIYSHIASTEHKEGVVGLWLHSLNHRNYPDLRVESSGVANDSRNAEAGVKPG